MDIYCHKGGIAASKDDMASEISRLRSNVAKLQADLDAVKEERDKLKIRCESVILGLHNHLTAWPQKRSAFLDSIDRNCRADLGLDGGE